MPSDPIDDFPKIRLEEDDLESFQRTRARAGKPGKPSADGQDDTADENKSASRSPSWLAFIFILLVVAGGAGYWGFMQYKVLLQAQNRITDLEQRLSATGEDMGQSAAALQVKVSELSNKTAELWEQMDKLWASAWRRNQAEIADLNKALTALQANVQQTKQSLTSELSQTSTSIALVNEQLENQQQNLQQVSGQVKQLSDADYDTQLGSLREKIIATALANNDLINQIDDLRRRIAANEKKTKEVESILIGPTS